MTFLRRTLKQDPKRGLCFPACPPEREFPALLVVWAYQQNQLFFWKRAVSFSRVVSAKKLLGVFSAFGGVFVLFGGVFALLGVFLFSGSSAAGANFATLLGPYASFFNQKGVTPAIANSPPKGGGLRNLAPLPRPLCSVCLFGFTPASYIHS